MLDSLFGDNIAYPTLIFLCIILIWVGANMWITHFAFDSGESKTMVRNGGVVLLTGLLLGGAINLWRTIRRD